MKLPVSYQNGLNTVTLEADGTRYIEGDLKFLYPLNIDIRVSNRCSFGQRPDGSFVLCDFCHESARTDGTECDYDALSYMLLEALCNGLPSIELAIGCNELTPQLYNFLNFMQKFFVCNLTINSGHLKRDQTMLIDAISRGLIHGLGISYRSGIVMPRYIYELPHTVLHVIAGIDTISEIVDTKFKSVLVLGCKDFGFNKGRVDNLKLREWYRSIPYLLENHHVCFDNLAVEQLNMRRFYDDAEWSVLYQGEHSMYVDACKQVYAPSSRSDQYVDWSGLSLTDYWRSLNEYAA